ncbi:MAG: class I SAM-dependent methyltransferase [Candidatus Thorarchaeota archaeon]
MLSSTNIKPNRKEIIWNYFPEDFWKKATVLDCASGDGRKGMQHYVAKGLPASQAHAVDIDPKSLGTLKKLGVKTTVVDLEKANYKKVWPDKVFDLIMCMETLEHLTQEAEDNLLSYFMEVLSEGGHMVITFPVNYQIPTNCFHVRQPSFLEIAKMLSPIFTCFEMRKYGWRTYMMFFLYKKGS